MKAVCFKVTSLIILTGITSCSTLPQQPPPEEPAFIGNRSPAKEIRNFGNSTPSPGNFIDALSLNPNEERVLILRRLKVVSMELLFDFDSAGLTKRSKQKLNYLCEAMEDESLKGYKFRIEAHTDSLGSAKANKVLSERRADSVRAYLVESCKIQSDRLETVGIGEEEPLAPEDPTSRRNRRVQIVNLGRPQR